MKEGKIVEMKIPKEVVGPEGATRVVAAAPATVLGPSGETFRPLTVGALIVGSSREDISDMKDSMQSMANLLGPALLTVGLPQVSHLAHLLQLRDQDSAFIGAEESLQDLPWDIPRPPGENTTFGEEGKPGLPGDFSGRDGPSDDDLDMPSGSGTNSSQWSRSVSTSSIFENWKLGVEQMEDCNVEEHVEEWVEDSLQFESVSYRVERAQSEQVDSCEASDAVVDKKKESSEMDDIVKKESNEMDDIIKKGASGIDDIVKKGASGMDEAIDSGCFDAGKPILKSNHPSLPSRDQVKVAAFCSLYLIVAMTHAVVNGLTWTTTVSMLGSSLGLASAAAGLLGQNTWLSARQHMLMTLFTILNCIFCMIGNSGFSSWPDLKIRLAKSLFLLEGSLAVSGVSPKLSAAAHLAVGLAGAGCAVLVLQD